MNSLKETSPSRNFCNLVVRKLCNLVTKVSLIGFHIAQVLKMRCSFILDVQTNEVCFGVLPLPLSTTKVERKKLTHKVASKDIGRPQKNKV
jgi:hypothetical protein